MPEITEFLALPEETRRRQLKRLVYETVPDGEVKETAAAVGIETYTLYKHRDENRENHDLVHPRLLAIMHHRRDLRLLDFIEHLFGRAAFNVPQPCESHTNINRASTKAIKTFSAMMEEVADLVERLDDGENMLDGDWDLELREIEQACRLAQGKLETLLHSVRLARGTCKLVKLGVAGNGPQWAAVHGEKPGLTADERR